MTFLRNVGPAGWFFAIWALDYLATAYLHFPFIYCWGSAVLTPLLAPLSSLAILSCAGFFFFAAIGYGLFSRHAIGAVFTLFMIAGAPQFCATLFAFGRPGLCH